MFDISFYPSVDAVTTATFPSSLLAAAADILLTITKLVGRTNCLLATLNITRHVFWYSKIIIMVKFNHECMNIGFYLVSKKIIDDSYPMAN